MEPSSFLSSYTGISPGTMQLLGMGPLDLNKDKVLNRQVKSNSDKENNEKIDLSDYTDMFNPRRDKN